LVVNLRLRVMIFVVLNCIVRYDTMYVIS
jgi:hypothetical protein